LSTYFDAVDAGQSDIEDDDIGIDLTCQCESARSVVGHGQLEALALQIARNHVSQGLFVVDYQRPEAPGPRRCDFVHIPIVPADR
jgi:hypothetical protein